MNLDGIERLESIRQHLDINGAAKIDDLAAEHQVSKMTIRRDLDVLVGEGIALRVRGGATAIGPQQFAQRYEHHAKAKARISEKLIELVGAGGAIGVDASTTMQRLARTAQLGQRSHRADKRPRHLPLAPGPTPASQRC